MSQIDKSWRLYPYANEDNREFVNFNFLGIAPEERRQRIQFSMGSLEFFE
jgi:hypothetical protein